MSAGQAVPVMAVLRARARGAAEACARKWIKERCTRARQQQVSRSAGSIESRAPQRFVAEARCRTAARGYLTRIAMLPRPAQRAWQDVERARHCARTKSGRGKEDRARYSYVIGSPSREHGETEQPLSPPRDEPTRSSSRDAAVRLHSPTRRRLERPQCIQTSRTSVGETLLLLLSFLAICLYPGENWHSPKAPK